MKKVLIVLGAVVIGVIAISLGHLIQMSIFPLPEGVSMKDTEAFHEYTKNIPLGTGISVILAHALGPFCAGLFIGKMDKVSGQAWMLVLGLLFTIMGVYNWMTIPSPQWFMVADTAAYLPAAWAGWRLMK